MTPNPQSSGSLSPEREAELIRKVEEGERYRSFLIDIGRHLDLLGTNISDLPAAVAAERKAREEAKREREVSFLENLKALQAADDERDAALREAEELRRCFEESDDLGYCYWRDVSVPKVQAQAERLREAVGKEIVGLLRESGLAQNPNNEMEAHDWCSGCEEDEAECSCRDGESRAVAGRLAQALAPEGPPATERSGEGPDDLRTPRCVVCGTAVSPLIGDGIPVREWRCPAHRPTPAPSPAEQSPQTAPSPGAGEKCCYVSSTREVCPVHGPEPGEVCPECGGSPDAHAKVGYCQPAASEEGPEGLTAKQEGSDA